MFTERVKGIDIYAIVWYDVVVKEFTGSENNLTARRQDEGV